jgi:hypothetical protein
LRLVPAALISELVNLQRVAGDIKQSVSLTLLPPFQFVPTGFVPLYHVKLKMSSLVQSRVVVASVQSNRP